MFLQEQQWIQSNNLPFVVAAEVSIGSVQDVQRPVFHGVVRLMPCVFVCLWGVCSDRACTCSLLFKAYLGFLFFGPSDHKDSFPLGGPSDLQSRHTHTQAHTDTQPHSPRVFEWLLLGVVTSGLQ